MMQDEKNTLQAVPIQVVGSQMDVVEEKSVNTDFDALALYRRTADRLLTVNEWGRYAGMSAFQLIHKNGIRAERKAEAGDFIRIDIPGPGTHAGMGYDWVKILNIISRDDVGQEWLAIVVQPSSHPLAKDGETAHFLKSHASSTFIVRRDGLTVFAEEHGRNEEPNTSEGTLYDRGRNFVVGMAAKLGMSYPQWKNLVKGLLED